MSVLSDRFGIPMPDDDGVEAFLIVTAHGGKLHITTNLREDELPEMLDQIADGIDDGVEFQKYRPERQH